MASPRLPSHLTLLLSFIFSLSAAASAYVNVPWQTQRYYGFDGPWQAVTVRVGSSSGPVTTVDLLPGGAWGSFIPSYPLCTQSVPGLCGIGGVWSPGDGQTIEFLPSVDNNGLYMEGYEEVQSLMVGQGTTAVSVQYASLVAVTTGNFTLPNGKIAAIELGTFSLGASGTVQRFAGFDVAGSVLPGYLFASGRTTSYSYGLHIGSANLNYSGSLVFGGFDQGRAIGPGFSYNTSHAYLLDISLGVELGESPFAGFTYKSGLLLTSPNTPGDILVNPDPQLPYLYLPESTCNAIAASLPITYDATSGYYLWNTDDPAYHRIATSGAYLGFEFDATAGPTVFFGANSTILIKVPFTLLNLFLTGPALPDGSSTQGRPYFPCMPHNPAFGKPFPLGRAFLQAAFTGHDWRSNNTWIAQAPGPGTAGVGLSTSDSIADIADGIETLPYSNTDPTLFAQSWEPTWSKLAADSEPYVFPIPTFSASPASSASPWSPPGSSSSTSSSSSWHPPQDIKLTDTAKTALKAVGGAVGALAAIAILIRYGRHRGKVERQAALREAEQQRQLQLRREQREERQRRRDERRQAAQTSATSPSALEEGTIESVEMNDDDDVPPPAYEKDPPHVAEEEAPRYEPRSS